MQETEKTVFAHSFEVHASIYKLLLELKSGATIRSLPELVDLVYALKKSSELLDDVRKEVDQLKEFIERLACLAWLTQASGENVKTEYCTGTPDVKQMAKVPKPGTEEYVALMNHFGVDPSSPVRPHWPSMVERLSAELAEGKPLPPGCDPASVYQVFRVKILKKRPVLDDKEALAIQNPHRLKILYRLVDTLVDFVSDYATLAYEDEQEGAEEKETSSAIDIDTPF
jgi:hypothetical protein